MTRVQAYYLLQRYARLSRVAWLPGLGWVAEMDMIDDALGRYQSCRLTCPTQDATAAAHQISERCRNTLSE